MGLQSRSYWLYHYVYPTGNAYEESRRPDQRRRRHSPQTRLERPLTAQQARRPGGHRQPGPNSRGRGGGDNARGSDQRITGPRSTASIQVASIRSSTNSVGYSHDHSGSQPTTRVFDPLQLVRQSGNRYHHLKLV